MKRWDGFLRIPVGRMCSSNGHSVAVEHVRFAAGHQFYLSTMRGAIIGGQPMTPIRFNRETSWHSLTEDGGLWMTDLPIEQAQADRLMRGVSGDVLVGGLGLGYVAQRLALKPSVRRVVVVEISPWVIQLVAEHLRGRRKLEFIEADVLKYMRDTDEIFDYVYLDTWAPDGERILFDEVLPMRSAAVEVLDQSELSPAVARSLSPNERVRCWNEDVMRGQLVMSLTNGIYVVALNQGITIETLATPIGNRWHDWKVPFYRYALEAGAKTNLVDEARFYGQIYGLPGWELTWSRYVERVLAA